MDPEAEKNLLCADVKHFTVVKFILNFHYQTDSEASKSIVLWKLCKWSKIYGRLKNVWDFLSASERCNIKGMILLYKSKSGYNKLFQFKSPKTTLPTRTF